MQQRRPRTTTMIMAGLVLFLALNIVLMTSAKTHVAPEGYSTKYGTVHPEPYDIRTTKPHVHASFTTTPEPSLIADLIVSPFPDESSPGIEPSPLQDPYVTVEASSSPLPEMSSEMIYSVVTPEISSSPFEEDHYETINPSSTPYPTAQISATPFLEDVFERIESSYSTYPTIEINESPFSEYPTQSSQFTDDYLEVTPIPTVYATPSGVKKPTVRPNPSALMPDNKPKYFCAPLPIGEGFDLDKDIALSKAKNACRRFARCDCGDNLECTNPRAFRCVPKRKFSNDYECTEPILYNNDEYGAVCDCEIVPVQGNNFPRECK